MKKFSKISRMSATFAGCHTRVKVGEWQTLRLLYVNNVVVVVQIALECLDCNTCERRVREMKERIAKKNIPHLWYGGWLILPNRSTQTWSLDVKSGQQLVTRASIEYLSETLGEICVIPK